ncbi:fumarylacetoacetate hydrolase family protein [Crocinitomicaceae bacterium CZZ-1]|uniref:Fumarylacetoacetate hydrolase family protein n=1 Tax=Taishania pollutisoli TaxID=2766479 RepID=A0A8J6U0F5_9FLAO|nr:fumarylacetoacetate hydrolase family protein [Taishania pollutisoli]MBC9813208.1 fumarylacetoacetate hydrolase family protein [Taishania pollutisoli]
MKIICIGRNYADHAKELKNEIPAEPVFFLKPDTALLKDNEPFYLPEFTTDLHYECEVVVKIAKVGKNIQEKFAHKYYEQISLGIDFTARDLQSKCKEKGLPWEMAKAFDNSAPLSSVFIDKKNVNLNDLKFHLDINGTTVQKGTTNDWIFHIDQVIAYVSRFMTLKTGDLIFTGTPAGVGPVAIGDRLEGYIGDQKMFDFEIR